MSRSFADKSDKKESHASANNSSRGINSPRNSNSFVDNRPEVILQREAQDIANNNLQDISLLSGEELNFIFDTDPEHLWALGNFGGQ